MDIKPHPSKFNKVLAAFESDNEVGAALLALPVCSSFYMRYVISNRIEIRGEYPYQATLSHGHLGQLAAEAFALADPATEEGREYAEMGETIVAYFQNLQSASDS